jgi:mannose-1-phosphate guanylyltransferase
VTTPKFILSQYEKFSPKLYKGIIEDSSLFGQSNNYEAVLQKLYPTFEKISFDNAILEKIDT